MLLLAFILMYVTFCRMLCSLGYWMMLQLQALILWFTRIMEWWDNHILVFYVLRFQLLFYIWYVSLQVVTLLKDDSTFIKELFARLKSPTTSPESKRNLVNFVFMMLSIIKVLQKLHVHYWWLNCKDDFDYIIMWFQVAVIIFIFGYTDFFVNWFRFSFSCWIYNTYCLRVK